MSFPVQTSGLPDFLEDRLRQAVGDDGIMNVLRWLRPPEQALSVEVLSCVKASRLSFADMLLDRMTRESWAIRLVSRECDLDGAARFVYHIDAAGHAFTYIARAYAWDGKEKVGRRSDGANRDLFGALFHSRVDDARIAREFDSFDMKDLDAMRTDSDVIGWTPANRSSRFFDEVVDALVQGRQPQLKGDVQYLMRNGGFQSSGRNGSISYPGIPTDHPLCHPFFADLFAIYLVRLVSIDLVNAVAKVQNPAAAVLDADIARRLGIGNSSGQGMCVALQRWPHWVSTWVVTRELAIAYAKARPVDPEAKRLMDVCLTRTIAHYKNMEPQTESYVTSNDAIAAGLTTLQGWLSDTSFRCWGDVATKLAGNCDGETREQFNSLLLELVPQFCESIKPYFAQGTSHRRALIPQMTAGELRNVLLHKYAWALRLDRTLATSHQHFWYHSEDHGEQRRGDRIIDPYEQFESFIDHVGLIQRLASVLSSYEDDRTVGEIVFLHPDLHFAISRVQYLRDIAYAEIRAEFTHRDFYPSNLIRFFLASLGIRSAAPLSIRYVRGTFFQDAPLPNELTASLPDFFETAREIAP